MFRVIKPLALPYYDLDSLIKDDTEIFKESFLYSGTQPRSKDKNKSEMKELT